MYIPNTMPKNATEMYDFLEPSIADGLFDSIAIVDDQTALGGKRLECSQNGNIILTIVADIADGSGEWYFIPHPAEGVNPDTNTSDEIRSVGITVTDTEADWCMMRCSGGIGFFYWHVNSSTPIAAIFVGKTSDNKTAFLSHGKSQYDYAVSSGQTKNAIHRNTASGVMYPIKFGDNTALSLWANGVFTCCDCIDADRTILREIPVVGERGSSDLFTTLFIRTATQVPTYGRQKIGDHYYGCLSNFAILDDDSE